jgi:hypothetical protein
VKKYRRIEITAFRRRITIVSGEPSAETKTDEKVCINDADSQETIKTESAEGQQILLEAVRLLEEKLEQSGAQL